VKALLESDVLVLRGALSRKVSRKEISRARVVGEALQLTVAGEQLALSLGAEVAARWVQALQRAPASLGQKLGLVPGRRVHLVGPVESPEVQRALEESVRGPVSRAEVVLAQVKDEAGTVRAAEAHARAPAGVPLWVVYGKGRGSPFGDGPVRAVLRARGLMDTKVAAVSETLSASRYHRSER
jgi:hypothetical protein